MNLHETLRDFSNKGKQLAVQTAEAQFGDYSPSSRTITRRFSVVEAANLVGVSRNSIYEAEKNNRLPSPDFLEGTKRRAGYTINQIDHMRSIFKTYPWRNDNENAVVLSGARHKGGSYTTSTMVHLAQYASMHGYRVLLIDMDPQGTAGLYHGFISEVNVSSNDTILHYMLGEKDDLSYCIRPTAWPNLDIIPGCLSLQKIESQLERLSEQNMLNGRPTHLMLRYGIETIMDDYDLILIDGSPNVGMGTMNMICASDKLLCLSPAELNDFMSTTLLFSVLEDLFNDVDLDNFEPDFRILVTKYNNRVGSSSKVMLDRIRDLWGSKVLQNVIQKSDEIGKGQIRMRTIYEQNKSQRSNHQTWMKAQALLSPVFEEILNEMIIPEWPSKQGVK